MPTAITSPNSTQAFGNQNYNTTYSDPNPVWGSVSEPTSSSVGWTDINSNVVSIPVTQTNIATAGNVFGVTQVPLDEPDDTLDVNGLKQIIKQAVTLYDKGVYNKRAVATEVDALRVKLKNNSFDANNSKELKNIFGMMVSDMFNSLLSKNMARDYDDTIDLILDLFPEGTGAPVVSKYAGSNKGKQRKSFPYDDLVLELIDFEKRNGIKMSSDKIKFEQTLNQFRKSYPERTELDNISLQSAFNAYNRNVNPGSRR